MQGTIRRNNVLGPMVAYSCHSTTPKPRVIDGPVRHGSGGPKAERWDHVMSRKCRYDMKSADERCAGCLTEYDQEYVDSLKCS